MTKRGKPRNFMMNAIMQETDNCIIWPYAKSRGYGQISCGGKRKYVHALVLEVHKGPRPSPNHDAAHLPLICHNKLCVNHRHLRWATKSENARDRVIDGTETRGEKHGNSKLTDDQVLEIFFSSDRNCVLADKYEINRTTISQIKLGKAWAWLTSRETAA